RLMGNSESPIWFVTEVHASGAPSSRHLLGMSVQLVEMAASAAAAKPVDQEYRKLLARMRILLWTTDRSLRITSCLGGALSEIGLRPEMLVGVSVGEFKQVEDLDDPEIYPSVRALRGETVATEGRWWRRSYRALIDPLRDDTGA